MFKPILLRLAAAPASVASVPDMAQRMQACVACHGPAMTGVKPSMPGLLGLPRD